MSLRNSLYELVAAENNTCRLRFNPSHPIFAGHFPGHPVVPGACLVQMAEELLSAQHEQTIQFTTISNLKFHKPVTPEMEVVYLFDKTKVEITNTELTETYAQFKATYMCADSDV